MTDMVPPMPPSESVPRSGTPEVGFPAALISHKAP